MAVDQRLASAKERPENQRAPRADSAPEATAQEGNEPSENQRGDEAGPDDDGLPAEGSHRDGQHQAIDDEKLAEIADRIQLGDSEEGKAALLEFAQMLLRQNPTMTPDDVGGDLVSEADLPLASDS
jgi:hypothetical protein